MVKLTGVPVVDGANGVTGVTLYVTVNVTGVSTVVFAMAAPVKVPCSCVGL
jgi:hypothetical protein